MARLISDIRFIGTIGNLTAYKIAGSDEIYIRSKGGHSRHKLKTSPDFINLQKNNSEFGGRSTAASWIRLMLGNHVTLAGIKLIGPLNSLLKPIQEMDSVNEPGQRSVLITKNPALLQGFNLNEINQFDSIVKNPCMYTISRTGGNATIDIPAMIPGINFAVPEKYPMFRFIAELGIVPDLFYTPNDYKPSMPAYEKFHPTHASTGWFPCSGGSLPLRLEMEFSDAPPDGSYSLMLSVGICFGTISPDNSVSQKKRAGAAKILAMI